MLGVPPPKKIVSIVDPGYLTEYKIISCLRASTKSFMSLRFVVR